MRNPFIELGLPSTDNPEGEEVGGAFSCQEHGCYSTVTTARYLEKEHILTWKCEAEHINSIKDFKID